MRGGIIMWKEIKNYALLWDNKKRKGIVKVLLVDDVYYKIVVTSAVELNAIGNILREEKNLSYNVISGQIACGWKPSGDEKEFSHLAQK